MTEWIKYRTGTARSATLRSLRRNFVKKIRPTNDSSRTRTVEAVNSAFEDHYDIVLISAYTMFRETCAEICTLAAQNKTPVVVGGPLFNHKVVADRWLEIDGLTGVLAGEPEEHISDIVDNVSQNISTRGIPGYSTRDEFRSPIAPLLNLNSNPFPDYSDFPWEKYPNRIIPIMTGRGCGWGKCTFCSDIVTTSGRSFRSRDLSNILDEMKWQSDRHNTKLFTFLDLKLNSDIDVWKGLAENAQLVVPGAEWTASVHAHAKHENGLSAVELKEARKAGLVRMTTGLESGSSRVLKAMAKGNNPEVLSETVRYASEAGISLRLTVIVGYPGETGDDVRLTKKFLDEHFDHIDRVVVNRFALQLGTKDEHFILNSNPRMKSIENPTLLPDFGAYDMNNRTFESSGHRRAMSSLLMSVHKINRKPLSNISTQFEGVM